MSYMQCYQRLLLLLWPLVTSNFLMGSCISMDEKKKEIEKGLPRMNCTISKRQLHRDYHVEVASEWHQTLTFTY